MSETVDPTRQWSATHNIFFRWSMLGQVDIMGPGHLSAWSSMDPTFESQKTKKSSQRRPRSTIGGPRVMSSPTTNDSNFRKLSGVGLCRPPAETDVWGPWQSSMTSCIDPHVGTQQQQLWSEKAYSVCMTASNRSSQLVVW